jgi:hypothetical protein
MTLTRSCDQFERRMVVPLGTQGLGSSGSLRPVDTEPFPRSSPNLKYICTYPCTASGGSDTEQDVLIHALHLSTSSTVQIDAWRQWKRKSLLGIFRRCHASDGVYMTNHVYDRHKPWKAGRGMDVPTETIGTASSQTRVAQACARCRKQKLKVSRQASYEVWFSTRSS